MKRLAFVLSGILLLCGFVSAENTPRLYRSVGPDGADAPSGRLILRVGDGPAGDKKEPGAETDDQDIPLEPGEESGTEVVVPPTFFGEVVKERAVFVLDISGSMKNHVWSQAVEEEDGNIVSCPSRLDVLKAELIAMIEAMPDGYEFDIVCFPNPAGSNKPPLFWKKALVEMNDGTRAAAINWINSLKADGGTPIDLALTHTTFTYPHDIDQLFCLCDGGMGAHYPVHFVGQFAPFKQKGCEFVGVHVGSTGAEDMIKLAMSVGGAYVHVD